MKKKIKLFIVGTISGIVLLYIWYRLVDFGAVFSYIKDVRYTYVLVASFLYLCSYFFRSWRWKILLSPILKIRLFDCYLYYKSGLLLNYLIPLRAGEFAKCLILKKRHKIRFTGSLPSILLDKMFDLVGIVPVLLMIPLMSIYIAEPLKFLLYFLIVFFIIGFGFILMIILFKDFVINLVTKLLDSILRKKSSKIKEIFTEKVNFFMSGINLFKDKKTLLLQSLLLSCASIVLDSLFFYSLFYAFGQPINFYKVLFGYTLIFLSYILPHPPAQIGSNEIIMILIFSVGMGLDKISASAIMSFSHVLTAILILVVGFIGSSYTGLRMTEIINYGEVNYDS